ncbi:MAG: TraB family protein [Candidatus Methanogaster sp.]|uniref:TraB family protein n=1 Tax=Candidatus Methanogaster sp. TaxID=3386292 RepID=A0AC61L1E9_9EURY|nr:MAG: TraB family protein [ANME-2 cluster archaeon]
MTDTTQTHYQVTCTDYTDYLSKPEPEIVLIGTAHVSKKSITEVKEVIARERPSVVAVELCPGRYAALKGKNEDVSAKDILGSGNITLFLVHSLLAYFQNKIGADMEVKPGSEMIAAIDAAEELGTEIALVDRDIQITLKRFIGKLGFFEKIKMLGALVGALFGVGGKDINIEAITEEDIVTQLVSELKEFSPTTASVLIEERDAYIAKNLLDLKEKGTGNVVAIVGAGHRQGIQEYLKHPEKLPDINKLLEIPKKRFSIGKIIGVGMIALVLAMFALVITTLSFDEFLVAFGWWFIINGVLSGLGAALARGHIYSVLTAFSVAWLTSLNPMIAAGWFAGAVELKMRKPSPHDIHDIAEAETFPDLMGNNLFRVILVAALANLGSVAGTFIGAWVVATQCGLDIDVIRAGITGALGI